MWIAACDDDECFLSNFLEMLKTIVAEDDYITFYSSGIELVEAIYIAKHAIDVLFLDVEMPGLSGLESAHEIRQVSPETIIVIITNFVQYALKSYEIKAFGYLVKPINIKTLKEKTNEARNIVEYSNNNTLHIKTRECEIFLSCKDIRYIESYDRSLYAHTRTQKYYFHNSMRSVSKELETKGFYRIHKSYLVNLSYIKRINKTEKTITMTDRTILPVGDRNIKKLTNAVITNRGKRWNL